MSDVTLRVISDETGQMLTPPGVMNLGGKGNVNQWFTGWGPPLPPPYYRKGVNLTKYVGDTVKAKVTATIKNNGTCPVLVTYGLYFSVYVDPWRGPDGRRYRGEWSPNKGSEDREVRIEEHQAVKVSPDASQTITPEGALRLGSYNFYPFFSVTATDSKNPRDTATFIAVAEPWYIKPEAI